MSNSAVTRSLATVTLVIGVVGLVIGLVFIAQGISSYSLITKNLREEKVTLGIEESRAAAGDVLDTPREVMKATETLREHRKSIAPTYQELLGGKRFDPTNPKQLTYAQGMNIENALEIAWLAFGVSQMATASGVFMVLTGVALILVGVSHIGFARSRA